MFNAFLKYEQDFHGWVNAGFPNINPLSRDFLEHLQRPDVPRQLWPHQMEAIQRIVYAYELLQIRESLLNIVTGGGKTCIMGAIVAWLKYAHGIGKFLMLCPNTIVRDRLEDDFENGTVFREFGFFPSGTEHFTNELGLHILERGASPQGILDNGIVLGNIQQLYQTHITGQRNLSVIMNYVSELAIFNDEAHNTPAPEYDSILYTLSKRCRFRLDTTATPDRADGKTPDAKMIYEYGIYDAQSQVPPIIKSVVVYQPKLSSVQLTYTNPDTGERRTVDEMDEEFTAIERGLSATQWVTDPDPMSKQIGIALDRLEEQKRRASALAGGSYQPILFVVALCIKDAQAAYEMLRADKSRGGFGVKALIVTEESSDEERIMASIIGKRGKTLEDAQRSLERKLGDLSKARRLIEEGSRVEAVVSVLMLREGWDVPPVSVILLLRKFSSRVYGQQVVGRGLRLNQRGEDAQEFCAIVDHEKLDHKWLWELVGAKIKTEIDPGSLFGIEDDLPPKRKPQVLVNQDKLIQIPEPLEEEKEGIDLSDLDDLTVEMFDYEDWSSVLAGFEYGPDVEISRVEIESVEGTKLLSLEGFTEIIEPPNGRKVPLKETEFTQVQLIDMLKNTVRDIAIDLLRDEGIGSHELGYLYGVLMDHIRMKLLNGASAGTATVEHLQHALRHRHTLLSNFKQNLGLVGSIVKYKKEADNVK
jgi:superfamily II DNA or RNA helicase